MRGKALRIAVARNGDEEILAGILAEKSRQWAGRGMPMWNPEDLSREKLDARYGNPLYVLGREGPRAFGGFLLVEADPDFWPELRDRDSLFLHKLVVKSEFGGRGYSSLLLGWAKDYARSMGKAYLRLDYNHTRGRLEELYRSSGFEVVDRRIGESGFPCTRAEAKLA